MTVVQLDGRHFVREAILILFDLLQEITTGVCQFVEEARTLIALNDQTRGAALFRDLCLLFHPLDQSGFTAVRTEDVDGLLSSRLFLEQFLRLCIRLILNLGALDWIFPSLLF